MSLRSKARLQKFGIKSIMATVPRGIVAFLEIKAGDMLEWQMDYFGGEKIVRLIKVKDTRPEVSIGPFPGEIPRKKSRRTRRQ